MIIFNFFKIKIIFYEKRSTNKQLTQKKNTNFKHFVIFVLSDLIQLVKVK